MFSNNVKLKTITEIVENYSEFWVYANSCNKFD